MKIIELFKESEVKNIKSKPANASAIFQATESFSEHSLFDMVEDHLPENTRVWQIQWIMSEDGTDDYRPQFIFAKTKNEAIQKFNERMKHPALGFVAIESIKEISFDQLSEGEVIQFPGKKKEPEYIPPFADFSDEDAHKWANSIIRDIKEVLQEGPPEGYDTIEEKIDEILMGDLPYDSTGRAQRMIIKVMLLHPDMEKINSILKRKYNYDLAKILFSSFNELQEGDIIRPFPDKMLWSDKARNAMKDKRTDAEKYDDALTGQQLQRMPDEKLDTLIQKKRKEEGYAMSKAEIQKHAYEMIDEIKIGLRRDDNNINEWIFELMVSDLPYDQFDRSEVVKAMLGHLDIGKINSIMLKKNFNLIKNLMQHIEPYDEDWATVFKKIVGPTIEEKKKKKKKKKKSLGGAWNKAEQYTKYDPPQTGNIGVSARAGFVGG